MTSYSAEALREIAEEWDALQTRENDHLSRRDTSLWLHEKADAMDREDEEVCTHELYGDGETNWCEWCDYSEVIEKAPDAEG